MLKGHAVPEVVTGKPISVGGSIFRREATGAGVVMSAERACDRLARPLATGLARELGGDGASLQAAAEWASRERGALLVEHSTLARERDAVVREASELLGSVLGEPFAATSVAGLRERLQSAL